MTRSNTRAVHVYLNTDELPELFRGAKRLGIPATELVAAYMLAARYRRRTPAPFLSRKRTRDFWLKKVFIGHRIIVGKALQQWREKTA